MRLIKGTGLLLLACAFTFVHPLSAQPISLTLAPEPSDDGALASTLRSFIDEVLASPDLEGLVDLRTIPFSGPDVLEAVRAGEIDLGLVTTGDIEHQRERLGPQPVALFNQPFVFTDLKELAIVQDSWLGAAALSELTSADLVGLAFWNIGITQFAADRPLDDLDDFRGLQIVTTSDLRSEVVAKLGATPLRLAFAEVLPALSSGIANTVEVSIETAPRLAAAFTHLTEANYRPLVVVLVANRDRWVSLPDQAQFFLAELARVAGQRSTELAVAAAEDARVALRAQNVVLASLDTPTRATFREVSLQTAEIQQPEKVAGYLMEAVALIDFSRDRGGGEEPLTPSPAQPQREGELQSEILFASDRNDESALFPDKPIQPRFRMGSKRLPHERYCGTAPIKVDPTRPFADENAKYFELKQFELIYWGENGFACRELFQTKLDASPDSSILLFVHGYNNTFFDVVKRATSLAMDTRFPGLIMVWSWPTAGGALDYGYDVDSAIWTRPHFRALLDMLGVLDGLSEVYLLSHSMGARIVIDVLEPLPDPASDNDWPSLKHLVFIAPDVATDIFRDQNTKARRFADRTTLYASSDDWAIRISAGLHRAPRAGLGGFEYIVVQEGLDSVDATGVDRRVTSNRHAYAFDRPLGVTDLGALIVEDASPEARGLRREEKDDLGYWRLA